MKKLQIPHLPVDENQSMDKIFEQMDAIKSWPIDCRPWPEYETKTEVSFTFVHNGDSILLRYKVKERYLAANAVHNGNIHEDSCVEFFISFNDDHYYNLEFNCLGFSKIGYGNGRDDRALLPIEILRKINFLSRINFNGKQDGGFEWVILFLIPKEIFIHHNIESFSKINAKGNFYKCGDGLPEPHFLTWNMIDSAQPDFHKRECFGSLEFE